MNAAKDAMGFFSDEHGLMRELLEEWECHESNALRRAEHIVEEMLSVLRLDSQVEKELFYPAVANTFSDCPQTQAFLRDAELAHAEIGAEMVRLEAMGPVDPDFVIRFAHLASTVLRHIDEEEALLSVLDPSRVDLVQLGGEMAARRVRLAVANGIATPGDTEAVEEGDVERAVGDRPTSLG